MYLPPELKVSIFSHLVKRDLKSLRLVCKEYETVASPFLFDKAYLAARQGVLDTFTKLTNHSIFSKYVKEIVYDSSWLESDIAKSFDTYAALPFSAWRTPVAVPPFSQAGYNEYVRLFEDQEDIQAREDVYHRVKSAMPNLPNIQRVVSADLSRCAFLPGDVVKHREAFLARIFSRSLPGLPRSLSDYMWQGTRSNDLGREYGGLNMLMRAIFEGGTSSVQDLIIGDGQRSCGRCANGGISQMMFSSSRLDVYATKHVFSHLRKLELTIKFNGVLETGPPILPDTYNLDSLLSVTDNLEVLKLASGGFSLHGHWVSGFSNTLMTKTWRHLERLELYGFEVQQPALIDMVKRHQDSLKYLFLEHFRLPQGNWLTCFTALQLMLPEHSVHLGHCLIDSYDHVALRPNPQLDDDTDPYETTDDSDSDEDEGDSFDDINYLLGDHLEEPTT